MKFAIFNVSESEQRVLDEWTKKTGHEVKVVAGSLNAKSVEEVAGCDGLTIKQTSKIADELVYRKLHEFGIKSLNLRIVGTDIVDFDLAKKYDLLVTNVPAYSPRAIAEMAVTQALYLLRKIGEFQANMVNQHDFSYPDRLQSHEIYTQTVGLVGVGHIGAATAQMFSALGAKVLAYDVVYNPANEPFLTYTDLDTVLRQSDIISLHTPLLPSTQKMIDEAALKKMKNSAILINCARGGLVDTPALIKALKTGEIAAAGLDALAGEEKYFGKQVQASDVPSDFQELNAMPNVLLTPHAAFYTQTAIRNMVEISLNDALAIRKGKRPQNLVH